MIDAKVKINKIKKMPNSTFTPDQLREYIKETLDTSDTIPDGHRGAFVAHYDPITGVRTAVAVKTQDGWQINGTLGWHSHSEGLNYGVNVLKTW